ncbi:MAG: MBL fold metallo-hydrolase [Parachlamydiales bacterium]
MAKFKNPHFQWFKNWLWQVFLWQSGFYKKQNHLKAPLDFSFPENLVFLPERPHALWINHATFLIRLKKTVFLTDPIWHKTCFSVSFLGPRRKHPPALEIEKLPQADFVLISHDHYDHLDLKTVRKLALLQPWLNWVLPTGLKSWFLKNIKTIGPKQLFELGWHQSLELGKAKITAVPAQHHSGRRPFGLNRTLWCGFVVEAEGKKIYFSGDTGYNPFDFKNLRTTFQGFDLSLLPIGAYEPRFLMQPMHVNPEEAVRIHLETASRLSLAMHWKTFRLTAEAASLPPYELFLELKKAKVSPKAFLAVEPGTYVNF